jgi:hypothetical protein
MAEPVKMLSLVVGVKSANVDGFGKLQYAQGQDWG